MRFVIAAGTDAGQRKPVNQDTFLAKTADSINGKVCMALVCDGMGGLAEGEKASQTVALLLDEWFANDFKNLQRDGFDEAEFSRSVNSLLFKANQLLADYGKNNSLKLGTTASVLFLIKDFFYTFHIGDTRIYKFDDQLLQLTQDHTVVAAKLKKGLITKEEAKESKEKHILLQCIGVNGQLEIQQTKGNFKNGDIFLICSDGFYNQLTEAELFNAMENQRKMDANSLQSSIYELIAIVRNRGETDNISAILIRPEAI